MPAGVSAGTIAAIGASAATAGSAIYSATQAGANIPGATATRGSPIDALGTNGLQFGRPNPIGAPYFFSTTRSPEVQGYLDSLKGGIGQANDALTSNINSLTPGFGAITQARLDAIHNAALKATSDLSGNLARRRVLGSSFGQNAVAQVTQQAGVDEANARAQSYLDELNAQNNLINTRLNNITALSKAELDQANFETTAGVNLMNGTMQTFQDNAGVIGQLAAANASGAGAALQTSLYGANGQPGLLHYLTGAVPSGGGVTSVTSDGGSPIGGGPGTSGGPS